jgi:hypothetical protein
LVSLGLMRALLLAMVLTAATVSAGATAVPGVEPLTAEELANLKSSMAGPNAIFIADGHAELRFHVRVVDSATHRPITGAKVSVQRDRRVARHLGRTYKAVPAVITDRRGYATLRAEFPIAADATGSSVFVLDSYVAIEAAGHAALRAPISPIYRLDFPRGRKRYDVPVRTALNPR